MLSDQKKTTQSKRLYERALNVMPGGCSRNTVLRKPHPFYARRGQGCYVTDVEGIKRVDFANNMASLIHGHTHPQITRLVADQLNNGTAFTLATEQEIQFAEHMCSRNSGFEKIRFVNSGTEAIMSCLKASRAYTGRPKIAKVEGAYHGLYDYAEISQTAKPENWGDINKPVSVPVAYGTPASALNDVVVIPFNDPKRAISILNKHADEIACVLLDFIPHRAGLIAADKDYVDALYQWTRTNNALLVSDEVITFRANYGGAQEDYGIHPDLTAMGKMIGGGFPIGALAGRKEVMDVMDPLAEKVLFPHSGTFSANPVTMTAGLAAMRLFDREAVKKINDLGEYARLQLSEAISISGADACVSGVGSMFRVHLKPMAPTTYRESYMTPSESQKLRMLIDHLFDSGFMMINTCTGMLSTQIGKTQIDHLADAVLVGLRRIKNTIL